MAKDKDDRFRPRLGKLRSGGDRQAKRFISRVLNAAGRINPGFSLGRGRASGHVSGRNIGKGYKVGRYLSSEGGKFQSYRRRRVIVKFRSQKLAGQGTTKAAAHLRYIQRDGVSKEDEPGQLYNAAGDDVSGEEFHERSKGDRHQFRFIVSAEDANELQNLKGFTRDLMAQMETDLGTKLDWVAVDHFNTDNPHTHVIVRGKDETNRDLVIARDYIAHGIRNRAQEIATLELGPRQDHEIQESLRQETQQDRFTSIDRQLLRAEKRGLVDMRSPPPADYGRFKHGLQMRRLEKLEHMGLAEKTEQGVWRLSPELEPTLRQLGERGDIIKMMQAEMRRIGREDLTPDHEIFRPDEQADKKIVGRVISKGLSDEQYDRYYVVVDGLDGKAHYVDAGQMADVESVKAGSIVEIEGRQAEPREVDHTIARVAADKNGLYSAEFHAEADPEASREFIRTHIRRLEALRRNQIAQRFADGSWDIPDNYLEAVTDHENREVARSPVSLAVRSNFSLEVQANATGATWLDRTLLNRDRVAISSTGFGAEAESALRKRQAYLVSQGFADDTGYTVAYKAGLIKLLERRELNKVAAEVAQETGKAYSEVKSGQRITGVYKRPLELVSGKYAVIEKSKEFTLVPWRPVLERARNNAVSGRATAGGISWDITRQKGLSIS